MKTLWLFFQVDKKNGWISKSLVKSGVVSITSCNRLSVDVYSRKKNRIIAVMRSLTYWKSKYKISCRSAGFFLLLHFDNFTCRFMHIFKSWIIENQLYFLSFLTAFNRTIVELKHRKKSGVNYELCPFNRTIVELKPSLHNM